MVAARSNALTQTLDQSVLVLKDINYTKIRRAVQMWTNVHWTTLDAAINVSTPMEVMNVFVRKDLRHKAT